MLISVQPAPKILEVSNEVFEYIPSVDIVGQKLNQSSHYQRNTHLASDSDIPFETEDDFK